MAKHYFRNVPDFDYVSRQEGQNNISEYVRVKNLFKRVKIREDLFNELTYFTKYKIVGDERPDQIANKIYGDSRYDWVILLSNNVMNVESEWPLDSVSFHNYMVRKYGGDDKLSAIHHYETTDVKDSLGRIIVRAGLEVPSNYVVNFYDNNTGSQVTVNNAVIGITNYEYEIQKDDDKRQIFLLKPEYLGIIKNDIDEIMPYPEGSEQYVNENLVRGDDIRIYS
jgi:hypothetical protein|tara:strand:+ start:3562 stop:4233 length:672 start_codon:yes stop_codon:yes gene_type:complete